MKKLLVGFAIFVVLLLVVVGILLGVIMGRRHRPPVDPAITKMSLKPDEPKQPIAKKLQAYLQHKRPGLLTRVGKLHGLRKKKKKGRRLIWLDTSALTKASKTFEKPLRSFLAALDGKGCYPKPRLYTPGKPSPVHGMRWMTAVKLVALHTMALTQGGEPEKAAALLLKLSEKLDTFERDCPGDLLDVMIWTAGRSIVLEYLSYPFAHPKLSVATRKKLLATLQKASVRTTNPMPNAMRFEHASQAQLFENLENNPARGEEYLMFWPWWDLAETLAWKRRSGKVLVYHASQPYGPGLWKETKSQKAFDRYTQLKSYLNYNHVGRVLLAIAAPTFQRYTLRWHVGRCEAAARHALFVRFLKKHKDALTFTEPLPAEAQNPLTKKAFGKIAGKKACAVLSPTGKGSFKGPVILGMPPLWKAHQDGQNPTKTATPTKKPASR